MKAVKRVRGHFERIVFALNQLSLAVKWIVIQNIW